MDSRRPPVVYADNAVFTHLINTYGTPNADGLAKAVEQGDVLLGISSFLLMEIHKSQDKDAVQRTMDMLYKMERQNEIAWMAWPDLVWDRELLHYEGDHFIPEHKRAFVSGPTNLTTIAKTDRALERDEELRAVVEELMADRWQEFNDMLDQRASSLERDRDKFLSSGPAYPFIVYVLQQLQTRDMRLQALFKKLKNKDEAHCRKHLPALWTYRIMRLAMSERLKRPFEPSDVRDMMHVVYLPYVEFLSVDDQNFELLMGSDLPDALKEKLVRNKSISKKDWTPVSHGQEASRAAIERARVAKKKADKAKSRANNKPPTDSSG